MQRSVTTKKPDRKNEYLFVQKKMLGGWDRRGCWVASSAGGVLLHMHLVGQGPAVFAEGAGWVGYIFRLSSLSNVLFFGRRQNKTEILWSWLLNPSRSCQLLPRTSSLSAG